MDGHFRAFSFVDRIKSVQPGVRIQGSYMIPHTVSAFSLSLVAEAVGQLAAWTAMAAVDFKRRPVAGLARNVDLLALVQPGQTLEISAELDTMDEDAIAYSGGAEVDGVRVIQMNDCVGPMVPMDDYDDPQAVRDRFVLLCGPGAVPGGFGGIPSLALGRIDGESGQWMRTAFHVPESADLFADHFPRRPVFPGTIFMELILKMAVLLAAEIPVPGAGKAWTARAVKDGKLRTFISPGDSLEFESKVADLSDNSVTVNVETYRGKKNVGRSRVQLVPEALS